MLCELYLGLAITTAKVEIIRVLHADGSVTRYLCRDRRDGGASVAAWLARNGIRHVGFGSAGAPR